MHTIYVNMEGGCFYINSFIKISRSTVIILTLQKETLYFSLQLGGLLTRTSGVRLPNLPGPVCSLLNKLVGDDPPPQLYSGATIQVQRSQRTDELERMMNEMQQRRYIRIGRPTQGHLPQPSEDQASKSQDFFFKDSSS